MHYYFPNMKYEYHKYIFFNTIRRVMHSYIIESVLIHDSDEYTVFNLQFVTQNTGYTYSARNLHVWDNIILFLFAHEYHVREYTSDET